MRISDWSSDVCSSDLAEPASDQQDRQEKACGVIAFVINEEDEAVGQRHCECQPGCRDKQSDQPNRADRALEIETPLLRRRNLGKDEQATHPLEQQRERVGKGTGYAVDEIERGSRREGKG